MGFRLVHGVLDKADQNQLLPSLARTKGQPPASWMAAGHIAKKGELASSWRRVRRSPTAQIIDAVAFAGPTHLMDGWGFLARALSAALAGDPHAARHLAYYAQLRAGLSILASIGVGAFNGINFIIDSSGAILRLDEDPRRTTDFGAGTHRIVWLALDAWARGPRAALFLQSIKVRGVSLEDCLLSIWPGFSATTSALDVINAWGMDLQRGQTEHGFRKISSYVPQAFNSLQNTTSSLLKFVAELWELLEPSGGGQFDGLDRYLLRSMMWRYHDAVHPGTPRLGSAMDKRYDQLPPAIQALTPKPFLLGQAEPNTPNVLSLARSSRSPALAVDMIARAMLLLRSATGIASTNLLAAGLNLSGGELRPWLDRVAAERGFRAPSSPLVDPTDLWADVNDALSDLRASTKVSPASLHDWATFKTRGLPVLTESERIGVWALTS